MEKYDFLISHPLFDYKFAPGLEFDIYFFKEKFPDREIIFEIHAPSKFNKLLAPYYLIFVEEQTGQMRYSLEENESTWFMDLFKKTKEKYHKDNKLRFLLS